MNNPQTVRNQILGPDRNLLVYGQALGGAAEARMGWPRHQVAIF